MSRDGSRIAYDRTGQGRPLVLLHGGFVQDRRSWHEAGYVARLRDRFNVIAVDLRGHGESARPSGAEAYGADRMRDDVHAVLDAEGVERTLLWGYSFGAGVALQLAIQSGRVEAVALGGVALGPWLTQESAGRMTALLATVAAAKDRGALEEMPLPPSQQDFARKADLRVAIDTYSAVPSWPIVEPGALRCPAMFYVGSENAVTLSSLKHYEAELEAVGAQRLVLDGLDHKREFDTVDTVVPACRAFFLAQRRTES
jgi:pimeloyl-ACP methyl ester carboxylesterase